MKRGPSSDIPKRLWNAMKCMFVTFVKLEQLASTTQSTVGKLALRVNACVNKAGFSKKGNDLTTKLRSETADHFQVGKRNVVEQRRLQWTTHYNLNIWFD